VVAYDFLLVFAGLRGTVVDLQAAEVSSQSQKEQQQEKERRGGIHTSAFAMRRR